MMMAGKSKPKDLASSQAKVPSGIMAAHAKPPPEPEPFVLVTPKLRPCLGCRQPFLRIKRPIITSSPINITTTHGIFVPFYKKIFLKIAFVPNYFIIATHTQQHARQGERGRGREKGARGNGNGAGRERDGREGYWRMGM
jgi:hypothetical protein